ncbi:glycoside hydrolase family 93 protein [Xylariales sp. PMI_506]|nr:glycoside hydrolase family 93 protein [Xylariales sp. PMI_506]
MMMLPSAALLALVAASRVASALRTIDQELIFQPPSNYTDPQVLYARTVELSDGRLLATWENYSPEPPPVYFPIYESLDDGRTWAEISKVTDQVNGWGLRYQPFLYELPRAFGGFPKGTVLLAGNSIPTNLSNTQIDLYASTDKGHSWKFVSHVAAGGEAVPDNGLTPVWEPFILLYQDTLIVYYSDQRDPLYGQKLSHQESKDLRTWSDVITDVAYPTYTDRPGMPTVAQLPNGSYIYTYEYGGGPIISSGYSFPVYYRIAEDPRTFASAPANYIDPTTGPLAGVIPVSSPYVVWTPVGGPHGSIVVSCGTQQGLYVNRALGDPAAWESFDIDQPVAYTRDLRVFRQNPDYLLVMGAGHLPPSTTNNVTFSIYEISDILSS